jgi:putative ABC transport system substrate-binding protein
VGDLALSGAAGTAEPAPEQWDALRQALAARGYVEGRNLAVERRDVRDRPDLLAAAAADLVRARVDAILARGALAVRAALAATSTIPIVAMDLDAGALAEARGNATGVAVDADDLSARQLDLLKELLPRLGTVTIVGDPEAHEVPFQAMQRIARARGLRVDYLEIRSAQEFGDVLRMTPTDLSGAAVVLSSARLFAYRHDAARVLRERGLPGLFLYPAYAEAGGLAAYGPDLVEVFRRCGDYLGRILAGARPADLPIARPERLRLVINEATARALGVTIPPAVRQRADQVIQ